MITAGCDVGSLYTKAVVLKDGELVAKGIIPTIGNISQQIPQFLSKLFQQAGISDEQVDHLIATGRGANLVKSAERSEDYLICLARAVRHYLPNVNYLLDLGGQSITGIHFDENAQIVDFMRNDKCASGSGRFLELMSAKLGVELEEIDQVLSQAKSPVEISNQCGVFAESEVITYINQGREKADILAGVCASVAKIASAQARRFGLGKNYTITGGAGRIHSLIKMLTERLQGNYLAFPQNPELAGAIGAGLSPLFELK